MSPSSNLGRSNERNFIDQAIATQEINFNDRMATTTITTEGKDTSFIISGSIHLVEEDGASTIPTATTVVASSSLARTIDHPRLEEFTFFPKLPIEVRLKIWKGAFPDPRYVEIQSTIALEENGEYDDNFGSGKKFYASHIQTLVKKHPQWKPPLLRVGSIILSERFSIGTSIGL
jgi:hypothetical protein